MRIDVAPPAFGFPATSGCHAFTAKPGKHAPNCDHPFMAPPHLFTFRPLLAAGNSLEVGHVSPYVATT